MPEDYTPKVTTPLRRLLELRAIGMWALSEGPGDINLWPYVPELRKVNVNGHEIEWYEASVAIHVAMRVRPSLTMRSIGILQELCKKNNEPDRFKRFETLVKQSLGGIRLTSHGYRSTDFSKLDNEPIWQSVQSHLAALFDGGYSAFLNSGTLLGVTRDKKLIEHDDDIDLAVLLNANTTEAAAEEWLQLRHTLAELGLLDTAKNKSKNLMKLLPAGEIQIDLFPAWFEGDKFFLYPHTFGELDRSDVLPLKKCDVTGNPIPACPEKMLAINYGAGWQVPDPYFKFSWIIANRRFRTFLNAIGHPI